MQQIYEIKLDIVRNLKFFIAFLCFFFAQTALFAQSDAKITIRQRNISVIQALKTIEKQTKMSIGFSDSQLKEKPALSLDLQDSSLEKALQTVLKGTGFTYEIKNNYIVIVAEEERQQAKPKTKLVRGVVVDEHGEPMVGVNVSVEGTSTGTITDLDGHFTLQAAEGAGLRLSYVSYATQVVRVGATDQLHITMNPDTEVLDEVVVTALGIKRAEKALSYNVQKIAQDELLKVKDANFVNSLNGKIAGVSINKSSTGVGGATRVVMRGTKSLEGDNNALYVVDGIPLFNTTMGNTDSGIMGEGKAGTEGIADFNPEDIESISVLSGPSAAALYGSNAANGVVLITTKKGQEGKLSIQVSSSSEFSKAYLTPEFQNTYGNKKEQYESWGEKLVTPATYDPKKHFFNTGTNFINSVTLTTGTRQNQTFVSLSSTNSAGIVPNNSYDRLNFTVRNTATFLNDKLQLDLSASYVEQKDRNMVSQGQYWNPVMAAYLFPRGESFDAIKTFETYDDGRKIGVQNWKISDPVYASQNPYWVAYRNVATNEKHRYMFNVGLNYTITDWLNAGARFRMDDTQVSFERKIYATSDQKFAEGKKGNYGYSHFNDRQEYADFILNVNKQLNDFNLAANLGWSYSNYKALERGYKGRLLGVTNDFSASNIDPANGRVSEKFGDSRVRNHALFANIELGYKSMLYLTLTGRNDWNSRLVNTAEESFFYPSVGLSAILSEMFRLPQFISYLKLRGSFTEVGAPVTRSGLTPGTVTTPIVGGVQQPTLIYPFTNFKAERTRSHEFGLSLRLWKRLSAEVTYYRSNTKNQTFLGDLPEFTGYKKIYLQAGNVENRGWEASLGYSDKLRNGLALSSTVTFSRNVNEIKEMVNDYRINEFGVSLNIPQVMKEKGRIILKEGGSIHDIYANTFFKKDHQGYVEIKADGTYGITAGEPVFLGRVAPDFNMGWNNTLSYKGVSFSFLINGRFGGVVTSSTEALLDRFGVSQRSAEAREAGGALLPGQGRVDAQTYYKTIGTGSYETSGYYVYKATNIRVQELSLGYTLPNRWMGGVLKDVTLSLTASNPWMLYCKAPFDPELTPSTGTYGQGNDYFMQPSVRSFGFGVKFKL